MQRWGQRWGMLIIVGVVLTLVATTACGAPASESAAASPDAAPEQTTQPDAPNDGTTTQEATVVPPVVDTTERNPVLPEEDVKTLFVAAERVECVGVAPMMCLQVREDPADEWQLFYDEIEGFEYEAGFEYELAVREETVENPPADGSSVRTILVAVVSKTPVGTSGDSSVPDEAEPLLDREWVLTGYGQPDSLQTPLDDTTVTLTFAGDGSFSGNGGCNGYFGSYTLDGDTLTIDPNVGATAMLCDEPIMDQEQGYFALLQAVATYALTVDGLELATADGAVLRFADSSTIGGANVPDEAQPLLDREWVLTGYGQPDSLQTPLDDTTVTLTFLAEGRVAGSGGCNRYFAGYTIDGDTLAITMPGSTMMACPEPIMDQEQAYFQLLQAVTTYALTADGLDLTTADGAVLRFVEQETVAVDLLETLWTLTDIQTGNAVSSVVVGSTVTATFAAEGRVTGSAGCNTYFAGYTLGDDNALTIDAPGSSRKLCPDDAVMQQENQYLQVLTTTESYSIADGVLTLNLSDGNALRFTVAE